MMVYRGHPAVCRSTRELMESRTGAAAAKKDKRERRVKSRNILVDEFVVEDVKGRSVGSE
jgi:hypothetical protein